MENEDGFTMIEVLIAAFILVLGSLAVFMAFSVGVKNIQRSRESQIEISVAQREVERIRVTPYDEVGTTSLPTSSGNAKLPESRITTSGGKQMFYVKRSGTEAQPLLTGNLAPKSEGVKANDGTEVTVYRFVTCEEAAGTAQTCKSKRVVVDVLPVAKANLSNFQHSYYELQSTIVDPTP